MARGALAGGEGGHVGPGAAGAVAAACAGAAGACPARLPTATGGTRSPDIGRGSGGRTLSVLGVREEGAPFQYVFKNYILNFTF